MLADLIPSLYDTLMGSIRVTYDEALARCEQAEAIITDYERQHDFKLPAPFRQDFAEAVKKSGWTGWTGKGSKNLFKIF